MYARLSFVLLILAVGVPAYATGDFNMDNGVDAADIDLLFAEINAGSNQVGFDLTGDALVDRADADKLIHGILHTVYGDITLDRAVDAGDLSILAKNWMVTSGMGWASGDLTGDGAVDGADLSLLSQNWLWKAQVATEPAGHAPEPLTMATVGLSVLVAGGLARRRRKSAAKKL